MRILLLIFCILINISPIFADNVYDEITADINKAGGVYYAYPVSKSNNTPIPTGYEPFYISHVGRHGSRFLLKESDYLNPLKSLELAHKEKCLTPYGEKVYVEIRRIYDLAKDKAGDLTDVGVKQQKQIAQRMFAAYPKVFSDSNIIIAHSTMVMRCAMSMASFAEGLKENNSKLRITMEPSERNVKYMSPQSSEMNEYNHPNGKWQTEYKEFRKTHTPSKTFLPKIFSDSVFVEKYINPVNFTCQMYNIRMGLQNLNERFELDDLFEPSELFEIWKIYNFRMYAHYSNYIHSKGVVLKNSIPLLRNIIERADEAIITNRVGADLRFGHDINIIPLTGLMNFEGCNNIIDNPEEVYHIFQDYNISPMASNIQLIFFKNNTGDVILKFMLNEREISIPCKTNMYPYYHWNDVKSYFINIIEHKYPNM